MNIRLEAKCEAVNGRHGVRLTAVGERGRLRTVMLYDLLPEEAERFERGRKYVISVQEERPSVEKEG